METFIRALVGFFGINRSLQWTASSIRRNVLAPLESTGAQARLFAHFNRPERIVSARSGEDQRFQPKGEDRLPFEAIWSEPQIEGTDPIEAAVLLGAPYFEEEDVDGQIRRNLALQLHSLSRLRAMVDLACPEGFDVYLLLRPDLNYQTRFDCADFVRVASGEFDILVPDWQAWGGLNDRFCIASRRGFETYTSRGAVAGSFIEKHGHIHAEKLLLHAVDASGLKLGWVKTRAQRVRANGQIHHEWGRPSRLQRLLGAIRTRLP